MCKMRWLMVTLLLLCCLSADITADVWSECGDIFCEEVLNSYNCPNAPPYGWAKIGLHHKTGEGGMDTDYIRNAIPGAVPINYVEFDWDYYNGECEITFSGSAHDIFTGRYTGISGKYIYNKDEGYWVSIIEATDGNYDEMGQTFWAVVDSGQHCTDFVYNELPEIYWPYAFKDGYIEIKWNECNLQPDCPTRFKWKDLANRDGDFPVYMFEFKWGDAEDEIIESGDTLIGGNGGVGRVLYAVYETYDTGKILYELYIGPNFIVNEYLSTGETWTIGVKEILPDIVTCDDLFLSCWQWKLYTEDSNGVNFRDLALERIHYPYYGYYEHICRCWLIEPISECQSCGCE